MTRYYTDDRRFTGTVLIEVGNEVDAERIRRQFSGETIDGSECCARKRLDKLADGVVYQLAVQHVLHPTQAYPSQNALSSPSTVPLAAAQTRQSQAPQTRNTTPASRAPASQPKASTSKAGKANDSTPGLTLLSRINKNGKAVAGKQSNDQAA
jgi:hypothetical protein